MSIEFGNHDVQALVGYFNTSFQALRKRFKESINYMQKIGKELSVQATHSSTSFFILFIFIFIYLFIYLFFENCG